MLNRARGVEALTVTPEPGERRWPGHHLQPPPQTHDNVSKRTLYLKLAGSFILTLVPIFGSPIVCCSFCFLVAKRPHRSGPSCSGIGVAVGLVLWIVSILTFIMTGWPIHHEDGWRMSGKILENYVAAAIFLGIWALEVTVTYFLLFMAVIWPEYHLEEERLPAYSDHRRHTRRLPSAEPPPTYAPRNRMHDDSTERSSDDLHRVPSRQARSFHSGPPPAYDGPDSYLAAALRPYQDEQDRIELQRMRVSRASSARSTRSSRLVHEVTSSNEAEENDSGDSMGSERRLAVPRRARSIFSTHRSSRDDVARRSV